MSFNMDVKGSLGLLVTSYEFEMVAITEHVSCSLYFQR
jgi:hypothetical protein